jgi:hypothetical protein
LTRLRRSSKPRGLGWFLLTSPTAATWEVWERIKTSQRHRFPVRVFLQQTVPSRIRRWIRIYKNGVNWIRNRTTNRTHIINVKSLGPGNHDIDRLMLYANFDLLVMHIEVGLSARNWQWHDERVPKGLPKFVADRWPRKHGRVAGLAYLEWEATDPEIQMMSPQQSEQAVIARDLYLWWKDHRPCRCDVGHDYRIWEGVDKSVGLQILNRRDQGTKDAHEKIRKTSDFYDAQDQAMLERLMTIRTGLWS